MRVLLTNDDGLHAPGIQALAASLPSDWEIIIVAPDRERSAHSHMLSLQRPLHLNRIWHVPLPNAEVYTFTGTPTDCTKFALEHWLVDRKPDLVISGLNNGYNLGSDVLYSGTVSAAMESLFSGIPSLALSVGRYTHDRAEALLPLVQTMIEEFFVKGGYQGCMNVNFPPEGPYTWDKIRIVPQGVQRYDNAFIEVFRDENGGIFEIRGNILEGGDGEENDVTRIHEGYITVTPLTWPQVDGKGMAVLESIWEKGFSKGGQ